MRFLLILIFTISLSTSSYGNWLKDMFKSTVTSQELVERDKKYYTKEDSELYSGKVEDNHKNGKTSFVGQYKNGMRTGEFITYYENGQIQKKETYLLGTQEGKVEEFNDDGSLRTSYVMKDGKYPDGPIKFLDKEGFVEDFIIYKNGKRIVEDFKTDSLYFKQNIDLNSEHFFLSPGNLKSIFDSYGGEIIDNIKNVTIYGKNDSEFDGEYYELYTTKNIYFEGNFKTKVYLKVKSGKLDGNVSIIDESGIRYKFKTKDGKMEGIYKDYFFCPPGKNLQGISGRCIPFGYPNFTVHPYKEINYSNNNIDSSKEIIEYTQDYSYFKSDEEDNSNKIKYMKYFYKDGDLNGIKSTYFKNGDIKKELYENGINQGEVK